MNLPTVFDCSARELGAYQVANTPVVGLHLLKLKRSYAVPTPGLSFRLLVPRIPVLRSFRQLRGSRSCLRTLQNYVKREREKRNLDSSLATPVKRRTISCQLLPR